jgi:hypothetical protein
MHTNVDIAFVLGPYQQGSRLGFDVQVDKKIALHFMDLSQTFIGLVDYCRGIKDLS